MRIPIFCTDCTRAEFESDAAIDAAAEARGELPPARRGRAQSPEHWYLADIEEDNAYVEECRHGHQMRMTLQAVRYELLFESGIVATLIGCHREAVSSIAAALERFFEFSIEVFTCHLKIERSQHDDAWKLVHKQTERQFGAFLFLFLAQTKAPFLCGTGRKSFEDWTSFRNRVIHQGHFPAGKKTMDYARYVFDLTQGTLATLKKLDADAVNEVQMRHFSQGHSAVRAKAGQPTKDKDGMYRGTASSAMTMMLSSFDPEVRDFDTSLAGAKKRLPWWGFPGEPDDAAEPQEESPAVP